MSNSIAPGSSAAVNVNVTALTTNPNVPAQYKTIILKKNLVNGINTLTQEMMSTQNTKYVIKYDYTLGENITVPANCVLEFDGGTVGGNFHINFNNCINKQIYYSWFRDFNTCNNSLLFMGKQELIIDKDITLTQPFTLSSSDRFKSLKVRGITSNEREGGPVITCNSCPAFDLHAHIVVIKDLQFVVTGKFKHYIISLKPINSSYVDIDCEISKCHFRQENNESLTQEEELIPRGAIEIYGRGAYLYDNAFQIPTGTTPTSGRLRRNFCIKLVPLLDPLNSIWHDSVSAMRAIRIKNNRFHSSSLNYMIGVIKNEDYPDVCYDHILIEGNLIDCNGMLAYFNAKNRGTVITNNIIGRRLTCPSLLIENAEDILISDNNFDSATVDEIDNYPGISSELKSDYKIYSSAIVINITTDNVLNGISILNNFVSGLNRCIYFTGSGEINKLLINNNNCIDTTFTRSVAASGSRGILTVEPEENETITITGLSIINNIYKYKNIIDYVPHCISCYGLSTTQIILKEAIISNNNGFKNSIYYSSPTPTPTLIDVTGISGKWSDIPNFSGKYNLCYFVEDIGEGLPAFCNKTKWISANGFSIAQPSGTTLQRPTGVAAGGTLTLSDKGFPYYDTDIKKTIYASAINQTSGAVTWKEEDGAIAGAKRTGTLSERPEYWQIYVGFQYMQVDTTNGTYPIWVKEINGSTVTWINATGATV